MFVSVVTMETQCQPGSEKGRPGSDPREIQCFRNQASRSFSTLLAPAAVGLTHESTSMESHGKENQKNPLVYIKF